MSICRVWSSLLLIASISAVAYGAQADRVLGPVTGTGSMMLPGTVHRKALPRFDQGPVDPSLRFGSVMLLTSPTLAQQRALNQLLAEQQDPSSPNYHRWLTPEQWADRFGLSQADIQKITTWLKSQGFTVEYVARGRNWISFSGSAIQLESAFSTAIHAFNVNGERHVSNATNVRIPAGLSGIVTGIRGLNDFHPKPRARVRPNYFFCFSSDSPCSQPAQFVGPGDIATLYDINPLYAAGNDGTGQKVAIAGQTDIYLSDINDFRTGFGLASITCTTNATTGVITACSDTHFKYVVANGLTDPGTPLSGDLAEADLDIEMASGVARGAQIIYVNSPANAGGDVFSAWYFAVDNKIAPVISLSYGVCEFGDNNVLDPATGADAADETELKKANTNGITFVNSSGDSGAAECDPTPPGFTPADLHGASATQGFAVSYPASSPEVTGVGGTATPLADFGSQFWGTSNDSSGGSAKGYVPEQAWNDDNELAQFCSQHSGNPFCSTGNGTTGWKAITSASQTKDMQQDLALLGDGISSTGGGASNCAKQTSNFGACVSGFPKPSWQTVSVSGQSGVRLSPDISFLGSPDFPGYIFCTQLSELQDPGSGSSCANGISGALSLNNLSVIGGTSASAPVFAGIVALLNQFTGSSGQGNINTSLYKLAAVAPNTFHDVSGADNKVFCTAGDPSFQPASMRCPSSGVLGFTAGSGFDLATGLGSMDVNAFALALKNPPDFSASSADLTGSISVQSGTTATGHITVTPVNNFSGAVSFACSGLPSGSTCGFVPTTVTPPGTTQTTVTITGGSATSNPANVTIAANFGSVSHQAASFSLSVSQAFSLAPTAASFAVAQGSNVDATVQITLNPPFAGTITFTCSDPAPASTCTVPPPANASGQVSFHITTTLPTAKLQPPIRHEQRIFFAMLLPGLLGIFFTVGLGRRRITQLAGLILVLGVSTLWMASCGGTNSSSGGNPGTTKGQYTITVTGTSGGSSSNTTFQLNVQ